MAQTNSSENPVFRSAPGQVADAGAAHWTGRAPAAIQPYLQLMRADRPVGWRLLLLPCWQGLALAAALGAPRWSDLWMAVAFFIGAVVMRGAGCTLNDIADRKFDAQVARTRSRPIPSGRVSVAQAVMFMGAQGLIGLAVLLSLPRAAQIIALASLGLVVIYPFMKRITHWPQLFLGLAFNWGALVAYAAHAGEIAWPALALYASGVCWTIGYDTIYAHMDKDDDIEIGVKSTALLFGDRSRGIIAGFYIGAFVLATLGAAAISPWSAICAAPFGAHLAWQIWRLNTDDPAVCLKLFKSNAVAGLLLCAGLATPSALGLLV